MKLKINIKSFKKTAKHIEKIAMECLDLHKEKEKNFLKFLWIFLWIFMIIFLFILWDFNHQWQTLAKEEIKPIVNLNAIERIHRTQSKKIERKVIEMTKGYPIEKMVYEISLQREDVAAYLIAIAKKESAWGKRTPKLNGQECYNLWGFRQKRKKMGSGGHTCFDNPQDAVETVSKRIEYLLEQKVDTPEEMVIWKCGNDCASHNPESVQKWIDDVGFYHQKFLNKIKNSK